jgi:hypothetical protein
MSELNWKGAALMSKTNFEVISENSEVLVGFLSKTLNCAACPCFENGCEGAGIQTKCEKALKKWLACDAKDPAYA